MTQILNGVGNVSFVGSCACYGVHSFTCTRRSLVLADELYICSFTWCCLAHSTHFCVCSRVNFGARVLIFGAHMLIFCAHALIFGAHTLIFAHVLIFGVHTLIFDAGLALGWR